MMAEKFYKRGCLYRNDSPYPIYFYRGWGEYDAHTVVVKHGQCIMFLEEKKTQSGSDIILFLLPTGEVGFRYCKNINHPALQQWFTKL